MSKRLASNNPPPKGQKRNRNGVSVTKQELSFSSPPPEVMLIWHANVKEPTTTRKSNAPIPRSQSPPPVEQAVRFEELDVVDMRNPIGACPKRPKQKTRNDSVSLSFHSTFYLTEPRHDSLDEDGGLGHLPNDNIRRCHLPRRSSTL